LLDICAIILSLAMAMILAFDIVAPRERWLVQWAVRGEDVKAAKCRARRFASNETVFEAV
jgi:hypothetical protein